MYGYLPGSSVWVEGLTSSAVYRGFIFIPSGVSRVSVSTETPLSFFSASFFHSSLRLSADADLESDELLGLDRNNCLACRS